MSKVGFFLALGALGVVLGVTAAHASVSSMTVNPIGTLSANGTQVALTGTITCTNGDDVIIAGGVIEIIGRLQRTAVGDFNNPERANCTGSSEPWSATFTANTSKGLLPGPANADVYWSDLTDNYASGTVSVTIRLKR